MKLELPKRNPKASRGRSAIQPPGFLSDLYKDMRDRRLIIPAVALLVAIVAVPILLKSSSEPAVGVPPAAVDPKAESFVPAVLGAQEIGVRDYHKRLEALKQKNPFGDKFEAPPADTGVGGGAGNTPTLPGGTPGASDAPASTPGATTPTTPATPPTGAPPTGSGTQTGSFVLVPRIDVEVGVVGRDKHVIEGVHSGDLLPDKYTPVLMYLDNSDDSQEARFLVSRDVSQVNGDGQCKPSRTNCQFLTLKDGETEYLRFRDDKRYSIRVTDIRFVEIPESEYHTSQ